MSATEKMVSLEANEVRTLIEILKFAESACPIDDIDHECPIDLDKIEALITKLENA
ncbi:MAG: hypothetical protein KGI33_04825 [Thaumarchaeota archaeon]|nr:hypothetical protein [Nitrososphaerota archaeon]